MDSTFYSALRETVFHRQLPNGLNIYVDTDDHQIAADKAAEQGTTAGFGLAVMMGMLVSLLLMGTGGRRHHGRIHLLAVFRILLIRFGRHLGLPVGRYILHIIPP